MIKSHQSHLKAGREMDEALTSGLTLWDLVYLLRTGAPLGAVGPGASGPACRPMDHSSSCLRPDCEWRGVRGEAGGRTGVDGVRSEGVGRGRGNGGGGGDAWSRSVNDKTETTHEKTRILKRGGAVKAELNVYKKMIRGKFIDTYNKKKR